MPRTARTTALGLVLVLLLAACGGEGEQEPEAAPTPAATPETDEAPSAAPSGEIPEAAREQLDWFLGVAAGAELTEDEYAERFAQPFRDQIGFEAFRQTLVGQLQPLAPITIDAVSPLPPRGLLAEATATDGTELRIPLSVDAEGRIEGVAVQPAAPPELDDPPESVDAAADRLAELGDLGLVAATVDGTECTADVAVAADEPAPIGSVFKLYVLGAVADAVAAGDLSWDDPLEITDDVKSLPSGQLQNRESGSTVTVRQAADLMIAISDNTAADLLLRAVGRDAVEAAQASYGHETPELNVPFLTTRELFALKAADAELRERWVDGDEEQRRAVVDELADVDVPALDPTVFAGDPIQPTEVEWFASPLDQCRAMATLLVRAEDPGLEPLAEILTTNPGVPADEGTWDTIAFKGGSEQGLVAADWIVTDADGNRYALAASVVDPHAPVDAPQALLLMAAARDLLPAGG